MDEFSAGDRTHIGLKRILRGIPAGELSPADLDWIAGDAPRTGRDKRAERLTLVEFELHDSSTNVMTPLRTWFVEPLPDADGAVADVSDDKLLNLARARLATALTAAAASLSASNG